MTLLHIAAAVRLVILVIGLPLWPILLIVDLFDWCFHPQDTYVKDWRAFLWILEIRGAWRTLLR